VVSGRRIPADFQPPRPGDVQRHLAGTEQAREIIGFDTRIGLREGIGKLADHLRATPGGTERLLEFTKKVNWTNSEKGAGQS
jgi:UDP-glucose 4-epimerase